jgi:periplasmic mercuric ion binding protein
MKNLLLFTFLSFSFILFGSNQVMAQDKFVTETFMVRGNCGMCKDRIENAVDIVGVKRAQWDEKTEMLTVIFNPGKITLDEIHRVIAKIGHTTAVYKADPEAYKNLHHCCKYVEHDHSNGKNH